MTDIGRRETPSETHAANPEPTRAFRVLARTIDPTPGELHYRHYEIDGVRYTDVDIY